MARGNGSLRGKALGAVLAAILACFGGNRAAGADFVRGDANVDGWLDLSDAVQMLLCTFSAGRCLDDCADARDANDDGALNIADPVYLLGFLFAGGSPPPAPRGTCGPDPTADALGCRAARPCAPADTISTARGDLVVVPIEHASLVLWWHGTTIYVDPVGTVAQYAGLPAPDIVLVTHAHSDHMSATVMKALVTADTVLVMPQAVSDAIAGSGVLAIVDGRVLANGESTVIGTIGIEAVPMCNITPERLKYHPQGVGNGYVLDLARTRVYVSGDTEDTPELLALTGIDLAFLCMSLPASMSPAQAASAALVFQPAVVYPYHYGRPLPAQDPGIFKSAVEAGSNAIEVRLRDWYP